MSTLSSSNAQPALLPILPLTGSKPKGKKAAPKTPPVSVIDPALVAYAMRRVTHPSPEPSDLPMGVEALTRVTDAERLQANELARQIVSGEGELTPAAYAALRAWSGGGRTGGFDQRLLHPALPGGLHVGAEPGAAAD